MAHFTLSRALPYTRPKTYGSSFFLPFPLPSHVTQTPDVPETGTGGASLVLATDNSAFCSCTPWIQSTGTISFKVRIALVTQTEYTVKFKLRNGASPQASPPISIEGVVEAGVHDSEFPTKAMNKSGLAVWGVPGASDPLFCIGPEFTTRTVSITTAAAAAAAAQSSQQGRRSIAIDQHVAGSSGGHGLAQNATLRGIRSSNSSSSGLPSSNVTVSLMSNINLQSSDGSTITLRGFTGMSSQTQSVSLDNFTINGDASEHVFSDGTTTGQGRYLGEDLTLTVVSGKTFETGALYAFTFGLMGPGAGRLPLSTPTHRNTRELEISDKHSMHPFTADSCETCIHLCEFFFVPCIHLWLTLLAYQGT